MSGALVSVARSLRGRFVLGEAVPHFIEHLREGVTADDPAKARYLAARSRRMEALADLELLRLKQARGDDMRPADGDEKSRFGDPHALHSATDRARQRVSRCVV